METVPDGEIALTPSGPAVPSVSSALLVEFLPCGDAAKTLHSELGRHSELGTHQPYVLGKSQNTFEPRFPGHRGEPDASLAVLLPRALLGAAQATCVQIPRTVQEMSTWQQW